MPKAQGAVEREIMQLPVEKLCPDPRKVRARMTRSELRRAAEKMKKCFGEPLPVCPAPASDQYMLLSDETRFRAALMLGYRCVPCEIYDEHIVSGAKFALSDPRFLFNSIEKLVSTSKRAGMDAEIVREDDYASASVVVTVHKMRR